MLETALKRDRILVALGLASIVLLAWGYIFYLAQGMDGMEGMGGMGGMGDMAGAGSEMSQRAGAPNPSAWGPVDFALMFLMWAVMMVAMMVPSAAPLLLAFAAVNRRRQSPATGGPRLAGPVGGPAGGRVIVPTGVFLSGYLLVWGGFSLAATVAQWGLHSAALLSPMMSAASPLLGGGLLLAAGLFQWSPLKYACLRHCRTPLGFLTNDWREGYRGALLMGLHHGGYCLGCCWALMGLLFVLGVMNLLWIAALSAFVLAEKLVPAGPWLSRISGLGLLAWGLALIITN